MFIALAAPHADSTTWCSSGDQFLFITMNCIKDFCPYIRQGDTCVIYISEHMRYLLKIEPDSEQQTKFGLIKGTDLIDHPYGVRYECKRGWILPLRLTPELWTQLLPHRTQILYQADISLILLQLDIKPGSVVVESGTGSGSLSHAILRAVLPNGHLYTFDINESRVKEAQKEFTDHGYGNNVSVSQRNVCEEGYGDQLIEKADACILDLPQTWSAIEHAYRVLKSDGSRLCTFSPCVEQVQQNVVKMMELKLKDIITLECLLRPFEVKVQSLRTWDDETIDQVLDDRKFIPQMLPTKDYTVPRQPGETVGHSGYLTFASKRP